MTLPAAAPAHVPEIEYPSSDGRPVGETGWHVTSTFTLVAMLREHLARRDAYVASNMFLYYEEGNPRANRAPDCMVILGVGKEERRSFKTWVEGAVPSVVFEFASKETVAEDLDAKRALYERLGVAEYFLYDPIGDCLDPRLRGYRLEGGRYAGLAPDPDGGLISEVLGLRLVPEGYLLRPVDLTTGRLLPTSEAKTGIIEREAERAEEERLRADLEKERADLEERRADLGEQLLELERRRAGRERQEAERERRRAEVLAVEMERLRALLGPRGGDE